MIKCLYQSLKIDTYYAVNSFLFFLRKLPIFKDLITDDVYKSSGLKNIIGIIGLILSLGRMFLFKFIYYVVILLVASKVSNNTITFYHILFIMSLLGLFINNRLLNVSMKKYLCIVIFNMDSKKYLLSNLFWVSITNLIFNSICLFILGDNLFLNILFVVILFIFRIIGEAFNIAYYRSCGDFWYNNTVLYFSILIGLLLCCLTPLIGFYINTDIIVVSLIIGLIISIYSFIYICRVNDYKILYKRINTLNNVMNNDSGDKRVKLVSVKNKDIKIDEAIIKNKSGYDYFNTIFFERHKSILLSSSKTFSIILIGIYIFLSVISKYDLEMNSYLNNFLNNRISWFVIIMYFINRGSVVTQAMFYNCDHAMLNYNFYRNPKVIVGLFKMRLKTLLRVNILPSLVISTGNLVLLYLTGDTNILNYIGSFLFINILSIFFSVHYLVIYYLLQPYDKNMKVKKMSYSLISSFTYMVCYMISGINMSGVLFSIIGLLFSVLYIIVGLKLVEKYAPMTFKIN
ncbi:MAG: hypothetical protein Q4E69_05660 [Bacilli bacterium]|nr:hypothetical protein [Bacilli bacterium]